MEWSQRVMPLFPGDEVVFDEGYLETAEQTAPNMEHVKGVVREVKKTGRITVVTVDWDLDGVSARVELTALRKIGEARQR